MKVMVGAAHSDHDHTRATVILWPDVDAITVHRIHNDQNNPSANLGMTSLYKVLGQTESIC